MRKVRRCAAKKLFFSLGAFEHVFVKPRERTRLDGEKPQGKTLLKRRVTVWGFAWLAPLPWFLTTCRKTRLPLLQGWLGAR